MKKAINHISFGGRGRKGEFERNQIIITLHKDVPNFGNGPKEIIKMLEEWDQSNIETIPLDKEKIYICECASYEHQAILYIDNDPDFEPEINLAIHLYLPDGFLKRLWQGLKFAFGYNSRYGNWDSFIFKHKDLMRLKIAINSIL